MYRCSAARPRGPGRRRSSQVWLSGTVLLAGAVRADTLACLPTLLYGRDMRTAILAGSAVTENRVGSTRTLRARFGPFLRPAIYPLAALHQASGARVGDGVAADGRSRLRGRSPTTTTCERRRALATGAAHDAELRTELRARL